MLKFVFWDVQHGSAAYLRTPLDQHIAIDLGTGSYGSGLEFSPLLHLKYKWKVDSLDLCIITHPHRDHLDDISNFDELNPRIIMRPLHLSEASIREGNRLADKEKIDKYLAVSQRYNSEVQDAVDPMRPKNNGGVDIRCFVPSESSTSNLNNHSVVTMVSYEGLRMIVPGDNEPASWNELLEREDFQKAIDGTDILLAPHHGRESGYCTELFDYISPVLTIVSDGRFCDTSATSRYSAVSRGWTVHKRSGGDVERNCVTTRNDGVVVGEFGRNDDGNRYIDVRID